MTPSKHKVKDDLNTAIQEVPELDDHKQREAATGELQSIRAIQKSNKSQLMGATTAVEMNLLRSINRNEIVNMTASS